MQNAAIPNRAPKAPKIYIYSCGRLSEQILSTRDTMGRKTDSSTPDINVRSPYVGRFHGEFRTEGYITSYRDNNSANGTYINGTRIDPDRWYVLSSGDILKVRGKTALDDSIIIYTNTYTGNEKWSRISVPSSPSELSVGRAGDIVIDDPVISQKHASFFNSDTGLFVVDNNSPSGVYVNNFKIGRPTYISSNDVVSISGYQFIVTPGRILFQTSSGKTPSVYLGRKTHYTGNPDLRINIVERSVTQRFQKKVLLKDIQLDISKGTFNLVLGGSGAGKTTFLNAVMGYEKATGQIFYDGTDIYKEYDKMIDLIGYVPQQESKALRPSDVVRPTLLNAAEMRLPNYLTKYELERRVDETLTKFGLTSESNSLVSKLSGGQQKRLNIATQYIADPALFFLDEPDSGLDGSNAIEVMNKLRQIADEGKIVMVISHSPDRAFDAFDNVIVLAKSMIDNAGRLVFFGPPTEACSFFGVDKFEGIVKKINSTAEGGEGLADYYIDRFREMRR